MMMNSYFESWDSLFIKYRSYLVSFAFRMTGSLADAEDLVQETFLKCSEIDIKTIENPKSFLTKVCSNKGIDYLRSAKKKREVYPGIWLPDEIPKGLAPWDFNLEVSSPEEETILVESLTTSFLLILEKLSPQERIVFLLKEVFHYSYLEISELLDKKQESCRKIAERAREAVKKNRHLTFKPPSKEKEKVIFDFFSLAKEGDLQKMVKMLSSDTELWGDGGGHVKASGYLNKQEEIISFFDNLISSGIFNSHLHQVEFRQVNYRPGVVISRKLETGTWVFDTVLSLEIKDSKIIRIYAQRNPEKLATLINL